MNFELFKNQFLEELPLELAYGYTLDRNSLHIILYEDKVSRIVVDSADNVLERIDLSDNINFDVLVANQKRFYPDRVNETFHFLMKRNDAHLSITNSNSVSEKKFTFSDVLLDLPLEEIPLRYLKLNKESFLFERFVQGKVFMYKPMLSYERMFDDVYVLADARMKWSESRLDDYIDVTEEEYTSTKEKWLNKNTIGNLIIEEIYTILDEKGMYLDVGDLESVQVWYKEYTENIYPIKHEIVKGYIVVNKDTKMCPDEALDYCYTYEDAFKELQRLSAM